LDAESNHAAPRVRAWQSWPASANRIASEPTGYGEVGP
jgi:hypothetical protein